MFGMTQEELASELGVEPLHISNIERGKKGISLDILLLMCKCFNVSMSDLLPLGEQEEDKELKTKMIDEIMEALHALEISQVGLLRAMICALTK